MGFPGTESPIRTSTTHQAINPGCSLKVLVPSRKQLPKIVIQTPCSSRALLKFEVSSQDWGNRVCIICLSLDFPRRQQW